MAEAGRGYQELTQVGMGLQWSLQRLVEADGGLQRVAKVGIGDLKVCGLKRLPEASDSCQRLVEAGRCAQSPAERVA